MSDEEALLLLESEEAATPEFLTSTQGWPALIGLAALSTNRPLSGYGDSSSPDEYFTEELYNAASVELQARLCDLSLAWRRAIDWSSISSLARAPTISWRRGSGSDFFLSIQPLTSCTRWFVTFS